MGEPPPDQLFHAAFARLVRRQPTGLGARGAGFVDWAVRHRLAAFACHLASQREPALARALDRARTATTARELFRAGWLTTVLKALEAEAASPIVFKGLGVAHLYYPSPGLRRLGDVDLLFRRDELDRAVGVLERFGFSTRPDPMVQGFYREVGYNIPLVHPRWGLLEAHHTLYEDCAEGLVEEVIRRAQPITILGARVDTLLAPDLFLILAVHWAGSRPGSEWVWLLDLMLIGSQLSSEGWASLASTADRWGMQGCVTGALAVLAKVWDVTFDRAAAAYGLGERLSWLERRAVASLLNHVAEGRPFDDSLLLARRLSGRPTRRGAAWLTEALWAHPGAVCLALDVDYSPGSFWWHRTRHTWSSAVRRLLRLLPR